MMFPKTGQRFVIFFILMSTTVAGCARSVTDKADIPLTFEITVTFRDIVDTLNNNYFLIVSPSTAPLLPDIVPLALEYFPTPGRTFESDNSFILSKSNGITHYYENYFHSWSDYIAVSNAGALLYKSEAVGFAATTSENQTYGPDSGFSSALTTSSTELKLSFLIQHLSFDITTVTALNFSIATSQISDGTESGLLTDDLDDANYQITLKIGEELGPFSDSEDFPIPGSADIISWRARIF